MRDGSAQSVPEPIHLQDPRRGNKPNPTKQPAINQFVPVVQVISTKSKTKKQNETLMLHLTHHKALLL